MKDIQITLDIIFTFSKLNNINFNNQEDIKRGLLQYILIFNL